MAHANPQTEARAIVEANWHTTKAILTDAIATALAAKDAELAKVRAAHQTYVGKLTEAEARAERQWAGWVKEEALRKAAEAQLAAKDANIKMLGEQMVTERLHGYELLERAERAEAQLAEANKALDQIANGNHGDRTSVAAHYEEIARRAREAQGGE